MGQLALILHAHLPFVRHPEQEHFLEEEWLFEAMTESYIPLLRMMQRLIDERVTFKLTMSITPTLCAMLQDKLLCERYVRHLDLLIDFTRRERQRNRTHPQLRELAEFYLAMFGDTQRFFVQEYKSDLLTAFRELKDSGQLEIIASAATHGLLPLLHSEAAGSAQAARAQIFIGRDVYRDVFSANPSGFWLPECAFGPGLDTILKEANVRWFVLDAHGLLFGTPPPSRSIYAPCYTSAGPAAFARDSNTSREVWSAKGGYPGDPAYREFYRDAGFDLPLEHLGPVTQGTRKFSGIKYHRITGAGDEKDFYDPITAEKVAGNQALHFVQERRHQMHEVAAAGFAPIVVAPFDAELFGHWWFEGPRFLEFLIRETAKQRDFHLSTPSEYLLTNPTQQVIDPAASTWGENGYFEVWLNPTNAWIYPQLRVAAHRMSEVANNYAQNCKPLDNRVLKQLARELLLAQSSDWAFLIKTGSAREYATSRTIEHLSRFNRLHEQLVANNVEEEFLRDCEFRDNLFPNVNWRYYIPATCHSE